MYAFPRIQLPARLIAACEVRGVAADEQWCLDLMEATGIVSVPGSGFGQEEGTYHARFTILPPDDDFDDMLTRLGHFQTNLYEQWGPPEA